MNEELQNEYVDVNVHDNYPSSDEHVTVPPMKVLPLKKICMTIGQLPTAYLETMTYYEMLLWFIGYLRDNIIPTVNNNGEALEEVQTIVMSLQNYINNFKDSIDQDVEDLEDYVNNYFENLDVQEEINNKLDEYVEDGTLEHIIASYLDTQKIYDTHTEMIADVSNLVDGLNVQTLGYYNINDGGGAFYRITTTESASEYQEELSDDLYATMIIENDTINIKQIGGKADDDTFDNKAILELYQTICNTTNKTYKLVVPSGTYYLSPTWLCRVGGFNIEGIGNNGDRSFSAPTFKAINNQDYIIKFGGVADMDSTTLAYSTTNTNNSIFNICFSTGEYSVTYGCLVLEYANYGFYDQIFFNDVIGTGLYIRSSWENYFRMMSFRTIYDFSKPCMLLASNRAITGVIANISSSSFDKIMFENISGDLIKSELESNFVNNQFNEINVEYQYAHTDETITDITNSTDLSEMTPLYLFNGNMSGVTFNTINWTGLSSFDRYITQNNINYYFKSLFRSVGGGTTETYRYDVNIGKISSRSLLQILTSRSPYRIAMKFSLGNYVETSTDSTNIIFNKFDLYNAGYVHYDSIITRINNFETLPYGTVKLYKNNSNGYINTDDGALNDKICLQRPDGSITKLGFTYPFNYDSTPTTSKWLLRLKVPAEGNYAFVLRGFHNDEAQNKTYNGSGLTPNSWITVPIEMNYDFGSEVLLVNLTPLALIDTLTLVGFNS